ncbi:MAG: integrase core domain-containing protein [Phycisphaerales bacterium]|nr:integrase core domain-containing protein [Phycisphaerales bacterium]
MPANPFLRLLRVLAGAGRDDLRRQVQYLKAENEILRSKIQGAVRVTAKERFRLAKLAKPLGSALRSIVSIAQPETVMRWIREADRKRPKKRPGVRRAGRPRTPDDVRRVVLRIARETGWGYTRILGELKKLHIKVSRSTVVNILREAGLPTAPERGERTWEEFIASHAKTLWACDFVQQRVLTLRGFRDAFLLVFVNVATRRAIATTSTEHPDAAWVAEQVARFKAESGTQGTWGAACRVLTRDRDQKFGKAFDGALRAEGITPVRLPHCAPNLNAHVERFIQTLQVECLDRFIVCGREHLDHLMAEFIEHYNAERPHSSIGHRPPAGRAPPPPPRFAGRAGPVRCRTRLGGVLRHYDRMAA